MFVAEKLGQILGVDPDLISRMDSYMSAVTGKKGVLEKVDSENEEIVAKVLDNVRIRSEANLDADFIRKALRETVATHERQLLRYLQTIEGEDEFCKAAKLAKKIADVKTGFFLKKSRGEEILRKSKPERLLEFLKVKSIEDVLLRYDVAEIWSTLRFVESNEWMHQTFEKVYSDFTADDFEEREIEIRVLGPQWREVAEMFVRKKRHNVSHLKEFGIIFLNPIKETVRGKFLRDFALLLHYFHEIEFYSNLFRRYANGPDFAQHLKSLLRGDVKEVSSLKEGEWLIVQRYLFKENPDDPRLFLPRVNPESLHWFRGERDIARLGGERWDLDLELWANLDWVGYLFDHKNTQVVSFDLEDNAMSEVSAAEGKNEVFNYHQKEALWTKIFEEYVGGEEETERLLVEQYDKGIIKF